MHDEVFQDEESHHDQEEEDHDDAETDVSELGGEEGAELESVARYSLLLQVFPGLGEVVFLQQDLIHSLLGGNQVVLVAALT